MHARRPLARVIAVAVLVLIVVASAALAVNPLQVSGSSRKTDGSLAARLAPGETATEYWDVTAWFDSGERFFARFLVTNQGPGERNAAAFGNVVLADGRTLPFKWGRLRDDWTLGPEGKTLKIGKARLDLSDRERIRVSVDSAKHGVVARFEVDRALPVGTGEDLEIAYEVEYAAPGRARGTIATEGASRTVAGSGAVIHTSLNRYESEVIRRRDEVIARSGEHTFYLSSHVRLDGTRSALLLVHEPDRDGHGGGPQTLELDGPVLGGDERYPVPTVWKARGDDRGYEITLRNELLRMNPLEMLPLPFRLLLSLGGAPQRVWANVTVTVQRHGESAEKPMTLDGVAMTTFADAER